MGHPIHVIATTISGSVQDWGKTKRIVPLFQERGEEDVTLYAVDSHKEARAKACELMRAGCRILISAGGSGTFNSILEGCYDAGTGLGELRLGFLRKGSADLLGKTLGMPDEIVEAVDVFVDSIRNDRVVPCDIIQVSSQAGDVTPRRFVGYGGAEIFGDIPYYTENRFIKYYKGILSQFFGDLGPFFVDTNLAILGRSPRRLVGDRRNWEIIVDGNSVTHGCFQAIIIVNGDLGKDLPFAKSAPLGSGEFHLFTIRDMGTVNLYRQLKHAFDASILDDPDRWGFESFNVKEHLELRPGNEAPFPVNVDGSTMECRECARFEIVDQVRLLTNVQG